MKNIIVLHEYGANNHYKALCQLADMNNVQVEFFEFRIIYQFIKSIYKLDSTLLFRSIRNFMFFLKLLSGRYSKSYSIVVGIAPYDWRVIFFYILSFNHELYLHTSWPYWTGDFQPKSSLKVIKNIVWDNFIKRTKGIFAVTEAVKSSIERRFKFYSRKNIHVVYHSIDKIFLNNSIFNTSSSKNIIFVGRIDESKGVDLIIDISKMEKFRNYKFSFVGSGNLSNQLIGENVKYYGTVNDRKELAKIFSTGDILLLPSKRQKDWEELFGMVIIEGLCCGLYPVVTDHIGPRELIGLTSGRLLDENDLKNEIVTVLSTISEKDFDKKSLRAMGLEFSVENVSKRWDFFND